MNPENTMIAYELLNTLYMVFTATFFAVLIGLPLGVILTITGKGHIAEQPIIYKVLGGIVNVTRSFPFAILMVALIPVTRAIVGTSLGTSASIVPLTIAAAPFIARLIESSLKEIDHHIIEATLVMGSSTPQIIRKVLLPEALPSIVSAITLTIVNVIGYSAMAGLVGGGGLGQVAIQYGYNRFNTSIMVTTVLLLILLVQLVQWTGSKIAYSLLKKRGLFIFFMGLTLMGCSNDSKKSLKVAASPVPHAEILEFAKNELAEQGIHLVIVVTDDYNTPNRALANHEIDANFFQHGPFLAEQIKYFHYDIESIASIELEPMGLYSKKGGIKENGIIAIPNDPSNEGRALHILHDNGIIVLENPHDILATPSHIKENPKKLKFIEMDAAMLPRTLDDVDAALINTNYALSAGLSPKKDALLLEDKGSLYVNILVIRVGDEDRPDIKALKSALTSEKMRAFILKKYNGSIIPGF